jgi:multidrug resistance efflux pump
LDLVNLANSLVDAAGALKQAKIGFEQREILRKSGAFNDVEVAEAKARLETAQKRVDLLSAIARSALESAKVDYARFKQLYQSGMVGAERYAEVEGKVRMLELIVRGAE